MRIVRDLAALVGKSRSRQGGSFQRAPTPLAGPATAAPDEEGRDAGHDHGQNDGQGGPNGAGYEAADARPECGGQERTAQGHDQRGCPEKAVSLTPSLLRGAQRVTTKE